MQTGSNFRSSNFLTFKGCIRKSGLLHFSKEAGVNRIEELVISTMPGAMEKLFRKATLFAETMANKNTVFFVKSPRLSLLGWSQDLTWSSTTSISQVGNKGLTGGLELNIPFNK